MDYAVIDLGRGDQWLTSRVFILAILAGLVAWLKNGVSMSSGRGEVSLPRSSLAPDCSPDMTDLPPYGIFSI
jgi:hypothetical protein